MGSVFVADGREDSDEIVYDRQREFSAERGHISAPSVSLPKGGGAIRGIGGKFAIKPSCGDGFIVRSGPDQPEPFRLGAAIVALV